MKETDMSNLPDDPSGDPQRFGNPMLDALEHSIENPHGVMDPLKFVDPSLIDSVARNLDAVEASVEGTLPMDFLDQLRSPVQPPKEEPEPPAVIPSPGDVPVHRPMDRRPPLLPNDPNLEQPPARPLPVAPPAMARLRGGGGGKSRRPLAVMNHKLRNSLRPANRCEERFCFDTDSVVLLETCWSCDKFRHWPDGTQQEPRMCWHLWRRIEEIESASRKREADTDEEP
jgi:hypothetical protein